MRRIALILAGKPDHGWDCLQSQKKHILDVLGDVDIFVVTTNGQEAYEYRTHFQRLDIQPRAFLMWNDAELELPDFYKDIRDKKDANDQSEVVISQRCIRELFGIYQGFELIKMTEIEYDLVIRCRIDMFIEEPFPEMEEMGDYLYTPSKTKQPDVATYGRFAYGNMEVMEHYTERFKTIREYERNGSDTWERELKYTLDLLGIEAKCVRQKMKRFGKAR